MVHVYIVDVQGVLLDTLGSGDGSTMSTVSDTLVVDQPSVQGWEPLMIRILWSSSIN
jgi:hypothetical protein